MSVLKKIIFSALIVAGSNRCFAQVISIRGGLNISQTAVKSRGVIITDNPKLKPGFHLGPVLTIPINRTLALETGAYYSIKGLKTKGTSELDNTTYLSNLNIAYIETPLTLKVKIFSRNLALYAFGGGYFAPALFGSFYENLDISKDEGIRTMITWKREGEYSLKRFDYGANMGFEVQNNKWKIGISYSLGFANLSYNAIAAYNRNFEMYFGYQLWNN